MNNLVSDNLPFSEIPREIADRTSIFAVCFCFLFSIAAHFPHLPLWVSGFVILSLGWRTLQNLDRVRPLPKWLLVPMVLIGGISVFAEYWTIVGRDAGLSLLTVMASFKLLESRSHRDMLILVFLCYFLIGTHFLFSQSIFIAFLMMVTLVVITATLVTLNQRDDNISIGSRLKVSSRLILMSIPLMLILFILVPRVPGPLWGLTDEQRGGITGLSDSMSPGKISNLIRSNEVAFRVEFDTPIPAQQDLYWRGPVMSLFNGTRWYQARRPAISQFNLNSSGDSTDYTVTLEPNGERWLLALDIPTQPVEDSIMTADFQLTSKSEINDLRRYSMKSRVAYQVGMNESPEYLRQTLEFPESQNPQTIALGRELGKRYDRPEDIMDHVLNMFRDQEFVYTLKPPVFRTDVMDKFLFESRKGFCEIYSGSFALLMRAAGVPARIVTGYQGGEYNEVGDYLIVRQSDAHAWVEIWIENKGWIRADPTAAVSPSRIEQGLDDALPDETSQFRIQNRNPLFGNLLYGWDNLQRNWNDWVLNYDQRKQKSFLNDLEIGIDDWGDMVFALVTMLLSVTGLYWLVSWYRERPSKPEPYDIYLNRLLKKMKKYDLEKMPSEDTRAFFERVNLSELQQKEQVSKFIELYNLIKYGRIDADSQSLNSLRFMVDSIRI